MDDSKIRAIQAVTGLHELEALRKRVESLEATVEFLQEQTAKAWALRRRTLRDMDALMGVECSLAHAHGLEPACGRCGQRPNGEVG